MDFNSDFKKDLEFGKEAEELTVQYLKQKYPNTKRVTGYNKGFDIDIVDINKTAEVKYDRQTDGPDDYTGNLFIECESRNGSSGIETTTADIWFYWYSSLNKVVSFEPSVIREMIKKYGYEKVRGGDSWTSRGYLIPVKLLEEKQKERMNNGKK